MSHKILNVCVTGAAGQIAYSFFPQLLRGAAFPGAHINLRLLDIPAAENTMKGVILELYDCNYPLLESVKILSYAGC
jgi:malate/lactate dehydrogenase